MRCRWIAARALEAQDMTRDAAFKRRVRVRMAATGEAYSAARAHLDEHSTIRELHITNGDSAARTLKQGGVSGPVIAWRDVLHVGPVPALPSKELAAVRARFLAESFGGEPASIERGLLRRDAALQRAANTKLILWFDADLYDQLQLIQVLDRLAATGARDVALVSVGEFTGRSHFAGLGELAAGDLVALRKTAGQTVGSDDLDTAVGAWAAFTGNDPRRLLPFMGVRSAVLRFLGEAIERLLQEYPWTGDGLSLTERRLLRAVESGSRLRTEAFKSVWIAERRPFLGDGVCFHLLHELASAGLLRGEPDGLEITDSGRDVLLGAADMGRLGLDRWVGGAHLTSPPAWRWDPRRETLVSGRRGRN
jgi:hypothetical protein